MDLVCCPYNNILHFHCTALMLDIFQTHVSFASVSVRISIYGTGKLIDFVRNAKLTGALSNYFSYFIAFFCSSHLMLL